MNFYKILPFEMQLDIFGFCDHDDSFYLDDKVYSETVIFEEIFFDIFFSWHGLYIMEYCGMKS